jgi:hypothetical protein
MKKLIITLSCLLVLSSAIPVGAQTRTRQTSNTGYERRYDRRNDSRAEASIYRGQASRTQVYGNPSYNSGSYRYGYSEPSFWDQHRDKITTVGGAVAGAVIGGLAGGKRGAAIGAIAGGGGAALYTYKIRDKYRY